MPRPSSCSRSTRPCKSSPALDERLVKVVELRFFAGLEVKEIAELLGVSEPTIKRDTRAAKAFLQRELARPPE